MSEVLVERQQEFEKSESDIDLFLFAIAIAKRRRSITYCVMLAMVAALLVSFLLPVAYTAKTQILPPQQSQSGAAALLGQIGALANVAGIAPKSSSDLYVSMLGSRTVQDGLIQKLDLKKIYGKDDVTDARKKLESVTKITAGKDGVISVEVDDVSPGRAASIANAYIEQLINLNQNLAITEASQRRLFLEKQLEIAKEGLGAAEVQLKTTQEKTGLIQPESQAKAIIEAVALVSGQIAAKEVQLKAMRSFATDQNPDLVRTEKELSGLQDQLAKLERKQNMGGGDAHIPTTKVPEASLEYVRKLRDVKYQEGMFEILAKQYELARIDEARDSSLIQVLDKAVPPERKSKPQRVYIVLLAVVFSIFISFAWAIMQELIEGARNNPEQVAKWEALNLTLHDGSMSRILKFRTR